MHYNIVESSLSARKRSNKWQINVNAASGQNLMQLWEEAEETYSLFWAQVQF